MRRGFMLCELIAVIVIICSAAAMVMVLMPQKSERQLVAEEAARAAAWFKYRMSKAARERVAFDVQMTSGGINNYEATVIWYGGAMYMKHENFALKAAKLNYLGGASLLTFDGRWHTMTPAATFAIKSKSRSDISLYMTISGTGYIDIREKL